MAIAVTLLTFGATTSAALAGTAPHQASVSPRVDFTCPPATVCVFPNDNYSGNYPGWGNKPATLGVDALSNFWFSFSSRNITPNPGSLHNNATTFCTWVFALDTNSYHHILPGDKFDLTHTYGYIYIQGAHPTCLGGPPAGAP